MRRLDLQGNYTAVKEDDWTQSLEKYFDEGWRDVPSIDKELELVQEIKQGSEKSRDEFIESNLRFVVDIAKKYAGSIAGVLQLNDLINEGNDGLVIAVDKIAADHYDETRGFRFVTYAVWWIRQSILSSLDTKSNLVRLPVNQAVAVRKINSFISKTKNETGEIPSVQEIVDSLEMNFGDVECLIKYSQKNNIISLDAPLYNSFTGNRENLLFHKFNSPEEDIRLLEEVWNQEDQVASDNCLKQDDLRRNIDRVLLTLPEREAEVLRLSFGIYPNDLSLDDIIQKHKIRRKKGFMKKLALVESMKDKTYVFDRNTQQYEATTEENINKKAHSFMDLLVNIYDVLGKENVPKEIARLDLTNSELMALSEYFNLELSFETIGSHMGLTLERIRQIKDKALMRMRYPGRSNVLKEHKEFFSYPEVKRVREDREYREKLKEQEEEKKEPIEEVV